MGHLLALHMTPANENDRAAVGTLAKAVQDATGQSVTLAYVDQGYTGEQAADAAQAHGIRLDVVKLLQAKRGFVLLPRRWVERSFLDGALPQARPPLRAPARNRRRTAPDSLRNPHAPSYRCFGTSP